MGLSNDLIKQFSKAVNNKPKEAPPVKLYGTTVEYGGKIAVIVDGSTAITPVDSVTDVKAGERVLVEIANHSATILGNVSSPAARVDDVKKTDSTHISAETVTAINGTFDTLMAAVTHISTIDAISAKLDVIKSNFIGSETITANMLEVVDAQLTNIKAEIIATGELDTDQLNAVEASITQLRGFKADFTYVTTDRLSAIDALIGSLGVEHLDASTGEIDFLKAKEAAIDKVVADTGLFRKLVVQEGNFTHELVAVKINADCIKTGVITADRLLLRSDDGLYYAINVDSIGRSSVESLTPEEQEILQNGVHGSALIAESVTADKIYVTDLSAFKATIGGTEIGNDSMHTTGKSDVHSGNPGMFMDDEGQICFGDANRYLKFYKKEDGTYGFDVKVDSIEFASESNIVNELREEISNAAKGAEDAKGNIDILDKQIEALSILSSYIRIDLNDPTGPKIILGAEGSEFKTVITHTSIDFMQGDGKPAYISNNAFEIGTGKINGELQQGAFVWKARSNKGLYKLGLFVKGGSN